MQKTITISPSQRLEMIDINNEVEKIVAESKVKEGICNVFAAHAPYNPNEKTSFMGVAVAKYSDLKKAIPNIDEFVENGVLKVNKLIPRDVIHILGSEVKRDENFIAREQGQMVERVLFDMIYNVTNGGFYKPNGFNENRNLRTHQ